MRIPIKKSFTALKTQAETIIRAHEANGQNSIYTDAEINALQAKLEEGEAYKEEHSAQKRKAKLATNRSRKAIGHGLSAAKSDKDSVANQLRALKKQGESRFSLNLMEMVTYGWAVLYGKTKIGIDEEGVAKNAGTGNTTPGPGNVQGQMG